MKLDYRLALFVAFALFLAVASIVYLNWAVDESPALGYPTSWEFHECYAETFDANDCSNGAYERYPPFFAFLSQLGHQKLIGLAVFLLLFIGLAAGTNSFTAPILMFAAGWYLFGTFVRGGTIPFFLFLVELEVVVFWWSSLKPIQKVCLLGLGLVTHAYTAAFLFFAAITCELLDGKAANAGILIGAVYATIFLAFMWPYFEYRGFLLLVVLAAAVVGNDLGKLEMRLNASRT